MKKIFKFKKNLKFEKKFEKIQVPEFLNLKSVPSNMSEGELEIESGVHIPVDTYVGGKN